MNSNSAHICVCELGSGPVGSYQLDAVEGGSPSNPAFHAILCDLLCLAYSVTLCSQNMSEAATPQGAVKDIPLLKIIFLGPLICLVCPLISFFSTLFLFCVLICPLCPPEGDHSLLDSDWLGGLLPQGEQSLLHHISQWSTFFLPPDILCSTHLHTSPTKINLNFITLRHSMVHLSGLRN